MTPEVTIKKVLILAGGTGGHIFPGLALADYLKNQGIDVLWLGTKQGMETTLVTEAHIPIRYISISGLRGKNWRTLLMAPFKLIHATTQALSIIRAYQPDVIVGMGGFVSGPGGIACYLARRPLLIHEQNAKAGLTNKILRHIAKFTLEGLPGAFSSKNKTIYVGNPVRTDFLTLPPPRSRLHADQPFRLLVVGGSLGARVLNEMVPRALALMATQDRPIVTHQTGAKGLEDAHRFYKECHVTADLKPFIKEMAQAYAEVDLVLCRAGALTIAELCAVGVGAILVPYPHAVDDHQTANAQILEKQGAAICMQQAALSPEKLADMLTQMAQNPEKRIAMAEAAYHLREEHTLEKIFSLMCQSV